MPPRGRPAGGARGRGRGVSRAAARAAQAEPSESAIPSSSASSETVNTHVESTAVSFAPQNRPDVSSSTAARAGAAASTSRAGSHRLRPKAIRRPEEERRELEQQELRKQNERAAEEARLRRAMFSRGRRGRGRGFGAGRGRATSHTVGPLGPFSQRPGSRESQLRIHCIGKHTDTYMQSDQHQTVGFIPSMAGVEEVASALAELRLERGPSLANTKTAEPVSTPISSTRKPIFKSLPTPKYSPWESRGKNTKSPMSL